MGFGDWIFLAVLVGLVALGAMLGFGKVLKFITGGIVGILISFILCYCFGGLILELPFVHNMLADLAAHWAGVDWLNAIHLEIIIYYIVLFLITFVLRIIIVRILKGIMETDVIVMRVLNKVFGAVLMVFLGFLLMGLIFQIIGWIGGSTEWGFYRALALNANAIVRPLYEWNPMKSLTQFVAYGFRFQID